MSENDLSGIRIEVEDLNVEFGYSSIELDDEIQRKRQYINRKIDNIDNKTNAIQEEIDEMNSEIERLSYNGDTGDLILAVSSGVLSGFLDAFFVGELGLFQNSSAGAKNRFETDIAEIHEAVNRFTIKYAQKKGYKGDRLAGAINYLENKYPVSQDNVWKGKGISSPKTHHLDDLAHHPSFLGLLAAILAEYLTVSVFANQKGKVNFVIPDKKDFAKRLSLATIFGIILWVVNIAEKELVEFDEDLPKPVKTIVLNLHKAPIALSILKTSLNWLGHLVSDLDGSHSTAGDGEGIPGLFISFFKEISMLPIAKESNLPKIVNDLYRHNKGKYWDLNGNKVKGKVLTHKLDLRSELTVLKEQSMPIIVNEAIVRTVYFIRHLILESREKGIENVDWLRIIPLYNRTIVRMMTVAAGTFVAVDVADAAIETAVRHPESTALPQAFFAAMILSVNFVGIGRFVVAVGTDISMGVKRERTLKERSIYVEEMIILTNSKLYYKSADVLLDLVNLEKSREEMHDAELDLWEQLDDTSESMENLYKAASVACDFAIKATENINKKFESIEKSVSELDPEYREQLLLALKRRGGR